MHSSADFEYSPDKSKIKLGDANKFEDPMSFMNNHAVNVSSDRRLYSKENSFKICQETEESFKNIKKSVSSRNLLASSKRNPVEMANDCSQHWRKSSRDSTQYKEFIPDCTSEGLTQLNLGSPVLRNKLPETKVVIEAKPKRPSSAGNKIIYQDNNDNLCPNLLASTVGISRKNVVLNLANMMFSKPEVATTSSNKISQNFSKDSRPHSARDISKRSAIICIQKYFRGYIARVKVARQKELIEYLKSKSKNEADQNDDFGNSLRLSDLAVTPKPNKITYDFKRNKSRKDFQVASELVYEPSSSKVENTHSVIIDILNRCPNNGFNKKYNTSNGLELDQTNRDQMMEDERDLYNHEFNYNIQESPLTRCLPDDEISIISSRIETNRKAYHNSTFEVLNTTKSKLKDESLRIVESIKKNKSHKFELVERIKCNRAEFECQNPIIENEEEHDLLMSITHKPGAKPQYKNNSSEWKKSLTYLKKSASEKKISVDQRPKESVDAVLKTHRSSTQKELLASVPQNPKKRPSSAGTGQNKCKPLDISKMKASLKLLKKSINKSCKSSSSPNQENSVELNYQTSRGPILPSKNFGSAEVESQFKRSERGERKTTRPVGTAIAYWELDKGNSVPNKQCVKGRQESSRESPNLSRMRRVLGSEQMVRQHSKRKDNLSGNVSGLMSKNLSSAAKDNTVEASEVEESIFERSAFENFTFQKFQQLYQDHISEYKEFHEKIEKEAERKKRVFKVLLKEDKISSHSFDRKLKGVEKWKKITKKEIKKRQKNFIQVLGCLQKDKFDLENYKKNAFNLDDSKWNLKDASSLQIDNSIDSVNLIKGEPTDYNLDKHVTPIRDVNSSNIFRGVDFLGNSNLSIVNSALKIHPQPPKPVHKTHESNISIDSSRWVKVITDKDKHLYSIVPFEYKIKPVVDPTLPKSPNPYSETQAPLVKTLKEIVVKPSEISEADLSRPSLTLKRKSNKRVKSIDSQVSETVGNGLNISNNSGENSSYNVSPTKGASKELVFELASSQRLEDLKATPIDSRVVSNPQNYKFEPKELTYDSPQKCKIEDDWNFKLPSIKSSSGHDHFRHEQSEHNLEENKDKINDSVSVEFLEKSPEVTVFISEKDLSPSDPFCSEKQSTKKSRIEYLRDKTTKMYNEDTEEEDEGEAGNNSARVISSKDINMLREEDVLWSSTRLEDKEQLFKKFEQMKEPEIDAVQMLKQGFQKKQGKTMSNQQLEDAEIICDWVFASIKEDVLANMFFPRVNVAMLRSKEVEEPKNHSYSSDESDESKSCEESATIDDDTIDKSVVQDDLFLHTDSKDVMNYVKEIMDIVRQQRMPEFLKNLGMPICKNDLAFLRDLQGLDYEVDHRPEFDVISIVNTNVYLTKERTMKSFKEKEYEEKVKAAKEANIPEDRIMDRRLLDLLLNFEHIHNKAVFDAINESLDNYRPYGLKGLPFSWSKTTRTLTFKNNNSNEVENVINKVTGEVNQWCKTLAGPLPESELMRVHGYVCNNSMQKSQLDEDRLVLMLALEIEQNEDRWVDYENEMTATKIDVSNLIYDVLIEETIHLLNGLDVKY